MKRLGLLGVGSALFGAAGLTALACSPEGAAPSARPSPSAPPPTGEFRESEARDFAVDVSGSQAKLEMRRVASLAYDVVYRTVDGVRVTLAPASRDGRINPWVAARSYGEWTLACVNSFADARGASPTVECISLVSATGKVLDRRILDDVWIRTLSESNARAYLSPHGIVHYDDVHGFTCRMLSVDAAGRLTYDSQTPTTCDEKPAVVVPMKDRRRFDWPREALATYAMSPPGDPADAQAPIPPEGNNPLPPQPPGGGGDVNPLPAPHCDAPVPPPNEVTTTYPLTDIPGIREIHNSWQFPDMPKPGQSLGFRLDLVGRKTETTNLNHCLLDKHDGEIVGNVQASLGTLIGSAQIEYRESGSSCDTLSCLDQTPQDRWVCGAPDGTNSKETLGLKLSVGGQFGLDLYPPFRPFCQGNWFGGASDAGADGGGGPGLGITCQAEVEFTGSYRKQNNEASGRSTCGSQCPNGRSTRFKEVRYGGSFRGGLEVEVAFMLGNGRVGMSFIAEREQGTQDATTCVATTSSRYACNRATAKVYASGCPGIGPLTYCFDWTHTIYRYADGDCPPFGDDERGESPGTAAGRVCARNAQQFWDWRTYRAQCEECCNRLPLPPPGVQSPNEFDRDCKAQCEDL